MAITTEQREEIIALFVGMFNAAPGAQYLTLMADTIDDGATLSQLAAVLQARPEFATVYPSFLTTQEFAAELVANLLGNEVNGAATTWSTNWVITQLNSGMSRGDVILTAIQAIRATPNPNYTDAKAALANKVEVATYYSVELERSSTDLDELQDVVEDVTSDDETVEDAKDNIGGNPGETLGLTVGQDAIVGTNDEDTYNALSINPNTGVAASTLTAFDSIDGHDGDDTLNVYADGGFNAALPVNATVKNIEVVNVYNSGAASAVASDASKFEGVEELWQHGAAVAVTKLASTTTAGFKGIAAGPLSVTAAAGATSVAVALDSVDDASTLAVGGAAVNTVNISGTVVSAAPPAAVASIAVAVNQSASATTVTVNSAVASTLTFAGGALANVDASGSTGAITYAGTAAIGSIKTGAGKDTVTLATATTATLAAAVATGAADDTVTVNVTGSGTTTVDTGAGKDKVTVNSVGTGATTITLGADDDTLTLTLGIDSVKGTDSINGGDGNDTVKIAGKIFDAEDYIILTDVVKSFESLELTSAAEIDASKLAGYTKFTTTGLATSTFTGVAAGQTLIVSEGVDASAAGYKAPVGLAKSGTLAGTLNITAVTTVANGAAQVTANAEVVNLTIVPSVSNNDGAIDTVLIDLVGDAKSATVVLVAKNDTAGTASTADDVLDIGVLTFANADAAGGNDALTTLTLIGNGMAQIYNNDGTALVNVNASALASKLITGDAFWGLQYTSLNTAAETITLGASLDYVGLQGSTYLKTDTITGVNLVDDAALAGLQVDAARSDFLQFADLQGNLVGGFTKATSAAATLGLVLIDLASSMTDDAVVFHFGGNTYIYVDGDATGDSTNADHVLNDADLLVKLTGTIDLDLLVDAL